MTKDEYKSKHLSLTREIRRLRRQYMADLITQLRPENYRIWKLMYPGGVNESQHKHAISQLENTIEGYREHDT